VGRRFALAGLGCCHHTLREILPNEARDLGPTVAELDEDPARGCPKVAALVAEVARNAGHQGRRKRVGMLERGKGEEARLGSRGVEDRGATVESAPLTDRVSYA
jgi:hypothetical protein